MFTIEKTIASVFGMVVVAAILACGNSGTPSSPSGAFATSNAPAVIDPTGRWCFTDTGGQDAANMVTLGGNQIRVSPIARSGGEEIYESAGPNIYTHSSSGSAYEFFSANQGVWRGGGRVLSLRRCN